MNVLATPPVDETPAQKEARLYTESLLGIEGLKPIFESLSNDDLDLAYRSRTLHHILWAGAVKDVWNDRRFTLPNVVEDTDGCGTPACAFCGQRLNFGSLATYATHFNSDGTCKNGFTRDYTCVPCGRVFESLSRSHKHYIKSNCLDAQREKARRTCETCRHTSLTLNDHAKHLASKSHHKATHPDEFKCTDCDLHFHFKSELDRHLQTKAHTTPEVPSLTCVPCGLTCRSTSEYERHCAGKVHRYKANPTERPNLTCTLCGITRPSAAQYQAHLATAKHRKKEAEQQGTLEDPSSPDDADASGSPDRQSPVPAHSPPLAC